MVRILTDMSLMIDYNETAILMFSKVERLDTMYIFWYNTIAIYGCVTVYTAFLQPDFNSQ